MHYTKKLRAALDFRNQNIDSLILGESTQTLVDVAATLAYGMRLTPVTFDSFLRGHLTEARLAAEMRNGILMAEADPRHGKKSTDSENHNLPYSLDGSEELPLANPHTDTHETPWAHRDDGKGKTAPYVSPDSKPWALDRSGERLPYGEPTSKSGSKGSDRDARRKALDAERSALDKEEGDERRAEMKGSVDREEAAFKPDSDTMQGVKHHADVLVKWLMKFPEAERGKQTQDVISKLLNAANKMLYDPSRHGGKGSGWGVTAKYKPTTGLDSSAEKRRPRREADTYKMAESFMGDPELEQVVLEGVVLNELKGLLNKLKNWFGGGGEEPKKPTAAEINRGKHPTIDPRRLPNDHPDHPRNASWNKDRNQDKTVPLTPVPPGHEDNPIPLKRVGDIASYSIKGIIDTIKAADISTHGQTTMLQNVVKFLTKQVGHKLSDPKGRQRQEIISGYVDQLLARQKGKKEMGMTLDIGKMGKELAADAFKIYKSEFAKRGYDVRIAMNSGRTLDLAITKAASKTHVDVPDGKRGGSLDATEKWEDTDRTEDDPDALAQEMQPWEEAPKGMTIVGALEMNGKMDERNQVATDGKKAALWSRSKNAWIPLDIEKLKLLAKGHKVQGVTLKRKSRAGASK